MAAAATVVPGFVDPHTHLVFAGDRRGELQRRLGGASYAEIAAAGRGHRAHRRRDARCVGRGARRRGAAAPAGDAGVRDHDRRSQERLRARDRERVAHAARHSRSWQHASRSSSPPPSWARTKFRVEYRDRRDEYLRLIIDEMIPAVARRGAGRMVRRLLRARRVSRRRRLARFSRRDSATGCKGRACTPTSSRSSGGSAVAADVGAQSADHLIFVDEPHARLLAARGVVATLLPTAAFYLKLGRFAPARMLIDCGVPVALATDVNPGGGFSPSMPFRDDAGVLRR